MEKINISKNVIKRLPRYYRYIGDMLEAGEERFTSSKLGMRMGLTPSQIRQDMNTFGKFGREGYGYNVKYLYREIGNILGLNKHHNLIIVGGGNMGQALANYEGFKKRGFIIKGIFDVNPVLKGFSVRGIKVHTLECMEEFIRTENIQIAVLTVPKDQAQGVADLLVQYGVKAIWNFAHLDLTVPSDILVENVHLSESLMELSYKITTMEKNPPTT